MVNPQSLNTFNLQKENTQTVIIEPEYNNNINKIQESDNITNQNNKNELP